MKMKLFMNMSSPQDANPAENVSQLKGMSINAMVWALVGTALFVLVAMAGFGFYSVYKQGSLVVEAVDKSGQDVEKIHLSQETAKHFRAQINAWNKLLLRGDDQKEFDQYLAQFKKEDAEVNANLTKLRAILPEKEADVIAALDRVARMHAGQVVKYHEALKSFDLENPRETATIVDNMVRGLDSATVAEMEKLTAAVEGKMQADLAVGRQAAESTTQQDAIIFAVAVTMAVAIILLFSFPIRKGVGRSVQHINTMRDEAEKTRDEAEQQNKRNQQAILRLLDEVADLADGDLTKKPVVTEDMTGAIADSLGYAIETLRSLVGAINTTAGQVASEAAATQEKALQLTTANDQQSQEINIAGVSVAEMTQSIEKVSQDAVASSLVAKQSLGIAKKGAQTVQDTIQGMETIREQIQETSKRIKRLGESSQEIGEIVGLIHGIAYQTNILALNAAIQASMAGEAGRGFSVVADEVQRLSKRVSNSTKQIESLVKAIQTDAGEAVISMEKSTSGVVSGTRLAQDAGKALAEIEAVSVNLDHLIEGISDAARQQFTMAGRVSGTMKMIQDISTQTSTGTREAAASIGQLTGMSDDLKKSVAGFKLPA